MHAYHVRHARRPGDHSGLRCLAGSILELEGHLQFRAIKAYLAVLDHQILFGDLGDAEIAQRPGRAFDGDRRRLVQESGLVPTISVTL